MSVVLIIWFAVGMQSVITVLSEQLMMINLNNENAEKVMNALTKFGFGDAGFDKTVFETEGSAIHLGAEPNAIDLLTSISSKQTSLYFENAITDSLDGIVVKYIALDDLIDAKKRAGRSKDKIDVEELLLIKNSKRAVENG